MKLLVITQKVDSKDSTLGFFHGWIQELSKEFESVEVICLQKGDFDLPKNVTVYSLGKERGVSTLSYIINFWKYLRLISGSYDRVFVHMNEEYVLLAGLYWKLKGIPVYFWRNHLNGTVLTRLAILFTTKTFSTSKQSFATRFSKTSIMPAGIDDQVFKPLSGVVRKKYSIIMAGRISPIKHVEVALEAIQILISRGVQVSLTVLGPVPTKDKKYFESLEKYVQDNTLSGVIHFEPAVSPEKLPEIYSSHEISLNLTPSGSFDKTIIEAILCGAVPVVSNSSLSGMLPAICITGENKEEVASSLERLLNPHEQIKIFDELKAFAQSQTLLALIKKLTIEMK